MLVHTLVLHIFHEIHVSTYMNSRVLRGRICNFYPCTDWYLCDWFLFMCWRVLIFIYVLTCNSWKNMQSIYVKKELCIWKESCTWTLKETYNFHKCCTLFHEILVSTYMNSRVLRGKICNLYPCTDWYLCDWNLQKKNYNKFIHALTCM